MISLKIPVYELGKANPVAFTSSPSYERLFKFYIDDEASDKPSIMGVVLANTKEEALEKVIQEYSGSGKIASNISIEPVKSITDEIYEIEEY